MTATCIHCGKPLTTPAQLCGECGARASELFEQAMAVEATQREAWLWQACEYREPLFVEVRALVDAAEARRSGAATGAATGPYIGVYKLLRELGRGGMGVVHLAVRDDGAFRKQVAVKLLLRENVTPEFVQRFKQERQVLAALDHPNIARILDGGDAPDGMPYYVMEYVEGKPVDEYCDSQRLSLTRRIQVFQQICQAVQYLHQNSILHRDLKPANILVSGDGAVKLLDFGIAKLIGASAFANTDVTSVQGALMTPGYASPEQMNGAALQPASDIYALGTILYFLLTGRPPFSGYEEKVTKLATKQGPPPPSANIRQDLQATESTANLRRAMLGQLDSIVLKTLQADPRDRYASAADLAADLQRFLDGEAVLAHHETAARRGVRALRRSRMAIAAAVLLVALAGLGGWVWQQRAESAAREAEVASREANLRGLLGELEARLGSAPVEERVTDVGRLRKGFATDYPVIAARSGPNEPLMGRAIRYLDRVQSPEAPRLGLAVADAYQQLGLLQESTAGAGGSGRSAALATYRKAAVTLASCPVDDAVRERMTMLRERAQRLGGTLEEAPEPVVSQPSEPVVSQPSEPVVSQPVVSQPVGGAPAGGGPARPKAAQRAESPVAPAAVPMPVAPPPVAPAPAGSTELQEEVAAVESRIQTAEATLAPVIANLERQGQTLNAETRNWMGRMRTMLEKGRAEVAAGNAAGAKESLGIARAYADKVLRSVGR